MPIYEYICQDCDTRFELRRSFSQANSPAQCNHCQSDHTKKLISSFIAFAKSSDGSISSVMSGSCPNCAGGNCANCRH